MQCGRVGYPRRIDEYEPATLLADCRKRRKQKTEFTYPRMAGNQLRNRTAWPATTGKATVQACVAGGDRYLISVGKSAFPQAGGGRQYGFKGLAAGICSQAAHKVTRTTPTPNPSITRDW